MENRKRVAIFKSRQKAYPSCHGFSPSEKFPEYEFEDLSDDGAVYSAVREAFRLLGLDGENYGTENWNPLGSIVRPGDRVVIKPNLVLDFNASGHTTESLITHASVLRPIIDYTLIALRGSGRIIVADSPHGNANFERIKEVSGLRALQAYYRDQRIAIDVLDLRCHEYTHGPDGFIEKRKTVKRDPEGYVEIDLGAKSAFADLPHLENLYGADFDRREIRGYHNRKTNRYLVAKTFLKADVIINVPKLKSHRKIGATLNLKSLVGINGDKNYLPHFRIYDPAHGGDEYPNITSRLEAFKRWARRRMFDLLLGNNDRKLVRSFKLIRSISKTPKNRARVPTAIPVSSGNWYGNETVYRTVYDLTKIIFMADQDGMIQRTPQRRFFSVIDGIIAGEKEGPLEPSPKPCGVIICGLDPVAVDLAATRLMGFDAAKMVVFNRLSTLPEDHPLKIIPSSEIEIVTNVAEWKCDFFFSTLPYLDLTPPSGWRNYIEIASAGCQDS